jgi:hypothetical protein
MKRLKIFGIIMMLSSLLTLEAFAASNIDTTNKYSWNSNSGWVNFNANNGGVTVYADHLEGYAWSENVGWVRLGTYTDGGTHTYTNASQTDYGVNHDGAGNLSGYGWSSNVGWIKFDHGYSPVTIDTTTGDFDGYAWSENVGWIHFQNASPAYKVAYDATPAAPTDLIASTASKNQIDLSWTDNSYNETGFKITRNGTLITTTDANATSYSNTSLSCDVEYSYTVIATNGNLDSSPATVTKTLNCPTPSYKLSIENPIGGTITGEGINCGSDCQQHFDRGTSVSLTVTPANRWVFQSWGGDCDETGTVVIKNDSSCTANLVREYNLILNTNGQGTIDDCGTECTQTHLDGETLSLTVTPAKGWQFSNWSGDCENDGQILIDEDKSCTANFLQEFTLTLNTTGEGTIENCGTDCTQTHLDGETVLLNTIPGEGWSFSSWSGDCDHSGQLLIESDKSCTATFVQQLTLNVTSQNGTVIGDGIDCGTDCRQTYPPATSITLTANPEPDFIFTGWTGDCTGTEPTTTLTLNTGKNCQATFGPDCIETNRLYINQTANGTQTGCDWSNAFYDLQSALRLIAEKYFTSVTEIWIAKGTYKPTINTDRKATFQLPNGIAIYGGFAGTETQLSERNSTKNQTILSGDIGIIGDNSDNSFHVITAQNVDATTIINGFVIHGGNANGDGDDACGGGFLNLNSSPTIDYLLFENNSATYGGGLCNRNSSHPTITHSFFNNNTAQDGGGIYNDNQSHPLISHVFLSSNTASRQGGGLFNQASSNPILGHVNFNGNTAVQGGGIANNNSNPKISHSILNGNQATDGGGLFNLNQSAPVLSHVIISGN